MNFSDWIQLIAAAATMILLITAAVSDITRYRIPNIIVYAIVAAFAVGAIFNFAWPAIVWPVLAEFAMFLLGAGLFALGLFGGGDVKLIAAMALWTGFADLPRFLLIMGAAGGLSGLSFCSSAGASSRRAQRPRPPALPRLKQPSLQRRHLKRRHLKRRHPTRRDRPARATFPMAWASRSPASISS